MGAAVAPPPLRGRDSNANLLIQRQEAAGNPEARVWHSAGLRLLPRNGSVTLA